MKNLANIASLTLWPNEKSKPTSPDLTGTCTISDKRYKASAWWNEDARGKRLSITVRYQLLDAPKPSAE